MKKLVSIATIKELIANGKKECCVDKNTIVTPAAADLAEEHKILFCRQEETKLYDGQPEEQAGVLEAMKKLLSDKRFLQKMIQTLEAEPYKCETDDSNVKLIYGDTIQMVPKGSCLQQRLFSQFFGQVTLDMLEVPAKEYEKHFPADEIIFLLEGSVSLRLNGKLIKARQGDFLYFPKECRTVLTFNETTKFLAIHP